MSDFDFLDLFYNNLPQSIPLLLLILLVYYIVIRPHFYSPIFTGYLAHAFACFVVMLLYLNNQLESIFFKVFWATETSFFLGWRITKKYYSNKLDKLDVIQPVNEDSTKFLIYYYIHFAALVLVLVAVLIIVGIIILKPVSRLTIFADIGYLAWLYDGLLLSAPYLWFYKRYVINKSKIDYIFIFIIILALFLKGGKSDVFYLIWGGYMVYKSYNVIVIKRTLDVMMMCSLILMVVATKIILNTFSADYEVSGLLLARLLAFGDAFYMGFNSDFIQYVGEINSFTYLFSPVISILSKLGLYGEHDKIILGFKMHEFYYNLIDAETGPNARHNLLGYILFDLWGAILFSFICGSLIEICNYMYNRSNLHFTRFVFAMISIFSMYVMIDPTLFIGFSLKLVVVFTLCYIITNIIYIKPTVH